MLIVKYESKNFFGNYEYHEDRKNNPTFEDIKKAFRFLKKDSKAVELAEKIRKNPEWNLDDCRELCDMAGIIEEWEQADGETFEQVVEKAAEILKVDIY